MQTVLAVDTSAERCSVTLWRGDAGQAGTVLGHRALAGGRLHAEKLVPLANDVLARAGVDFGAIDRFGVVTGPGSFTGVRIGLATVTGWMLATGKPAIGVSAFDILGRQASVCPRLLALDSRRSAPFFRWDTPMGSSEPFWCDVHAIPDRLRTLGTADDLPVIPVLGSAAEAVETALGSPYRIANADPCQPNSNADTILAQMVARAPADGSLDPPLPLYIRPPDAIPAQRGRTLAP